MPIWRGNARGKQINGRRLDTRSAGCMVCQSA